MSNNVKTVKPARTTYRAAKVAQAPAPNSVKLPKPTNFQVATKILTDAGLNLDFQNGKQNILLKYIHNPAKPEQPIGVLALGCVGDKVFAGFSCENVEDTLDEIKKIRKGDSFHVVARRIALTRLARAIKNNQREAFLPNVIYRTIHKPGRWLSEADKAAGRDQTQKTGTLRQFFDHYFKNAELPSFTCKEEIEARREAKKKLSKAAAALPANHDSLADKL